MSKRFGKKPPATLVVLLLGLLIPLVVNNPYYLGVLNLALIGVILAASLDLVFGVTGQISLCHASFAGIGAYATTLLMIKLGIPFWFSAPIGALLAALVGAAIGLPALRVTGHFLAMVTMGFAMILELAIVHSDWLTNGPNGLSVPHPNLGPFVFSTDDKIYYIVWLCAVFSVWTIRNILRSRIGRALVAVRDGELAAQAMGVDLARYKTYSFALSALYAGLAGALYAAAIAFISPYDFGIWTTVLYLMMVIIGGAGTLWGPVIGAIVLTILSEAVRPFGDYKELAYSVLLLLVIVFTPQGLWGLLKSLKVDGIASRFRRADVVATVSDR